MLFSTMKQMQENKQWINISGKAYRILCQDTVSFGHLLGLEADFQEARSAVVNHIFRVYQGQARASVDRTARAGTEQLRALLPADAIAARSSVDRQALEALLTGVDTHARKTAELEKKLSRLLKAIPQESWQHWAEHDADPLTPEALQEEMTGYRNQAASLKTEMNRVISGISRRARKAVAELLEQHHRERIEGEARARLRARGAGFYIRVDRDNIETLTAPNGAYAERTFYEESVGDYFKVILEEYAEQPYVQRERIFCADTYHQIGRAIAGRQILHLELRSREKVYVKPYGIRMDAQEQYYYLVCCASAKNEGPWKPAAYRLTSICGCAALQQQAFLSAETKKKLEEAMERSGVRYLSDSSAHDPDSRIEVQLTERGERMYRQIPYGRPDAAETDRHRRIYTFDCSSSQAELYFFRFGRDAKILKPKSLAEKFRKGYESAAKQYQ